MYQLKLNFRDGSTIVAKRIVEFVAGFKFLFLRNGDGRTKSYSRARLQSVERKRRGGDFIEVRLRSPKFRGKHGNDQQNIDEIGRETS